MIKKLSIRRELSAAAMAAGMVVSSPLFAQDLNSQQDLNQASDNQEFSISETWENLNVDPYNNDIPLNYFYILLALGTVGAAYIGASKRIEGKTFKIAALGTAFTAFANPQFAIDERRDVPSIITVFVDESPSIGDRAPLVEETFTQLQNSLASLGPVEIKRVNFGGIDDDFSASRTVFAQTFQTTLDSIDVARHGGSFIISDGVIADQSRFLDVATDARVHTLIAAPEGEQDYYIEVKQSPRIAFVDEDHTIIFGVYDAADANAEGLRAEIDVSYDGQVLQRLTVPVNEDFEINTSSLIPDQELPLGKSVFEFSIHSLQGHVLNNLNLDEAGQPREVTKRNNQTAIEIEGISSDIKVLLLSGAPYPGTRLWRDTLLADPSVSLTHFGYLLPFEKEDFGVPLRDLALSPFPVPEILDNKVDEFAYLIADNREYYGLIPPRYLERVNRYVEEGGSLLIVGSDALAAQNSLTNTPLRDIIPFTPDGNLVAQEFTPQMTDEGLRHPIGRSISGSATSWAPWYEIATGTVKDGARVLMEDELGNPLLITAKVGEGRVAVLTSDQPFIWATGFQGGGPATNLYRALSGWLSENPRHEEEKLSLHHENGQVTVRLQTMNDQPEELVITSPTGQTFEIMPRGDNGLYSATIPATEQGTYHVRRKSSELFEGHLIAGQNIEGELRKVISDTEILRPLSDQTRGITARVVNDSGDIILPVIASDRDNGANQARDMLVEMGLQQESIVEQPQPIPGWIYAAIFGLMVAGSFRQKEIVRTLSSPFRRTEKSQDTSPEPEV